jgi:hypothetical protein
VNIFDKSITSQGIRVMAYQSEIGQETIWLCNGLEKLFESTISIDDYSLKTKERLRSTGFLLTKYQYKTRLEIITRRTIDMDLVLDIVVSWVLCESIIDHRESDVINLQSPPLELARFYEATTHTNVFLLVEFCCDDKTVKLIEINPDSHTICCVVIMLSTQLITSNCEYNEYKKPFDELILDP